MEDLPGPKPVDTEAQVEVEVLSKLVKIERHGKYNEKNCQSVLDLWDFFSKIRPDNLSNYPCVFKRLVKIVSRTILSGLWAKIKENSQERLRRNVSSVQTYLEPLSLNEEKRQCEAITSLIDVDPWTKQSIRDIFNPQGGGQSMDKIDVVWREEGWLFLESRLETLTGLPEPLLIQFAEACALKAHAQYNPGNKEFTNYDLSSEKYFQVLCLFCVVVARRHGTPNAIPYQKPKPYLTPWTRTVEIVNRVLDVGNPARFQPSWKGWKNPEELGQRILEIALLNANESETEESDLRNLFCHWLRISHRLILGTSNPIPNTTITSLPLHFLPTTAGSSEITENPTTGAGDIEKFLLEKLKDLTTAALKNEYVYRYADWILEYFGLNQFTLAKCLELYLSRLSPEVSKFLNIHDLEEERTAHLMLSQSLGFAFRSLSKYFLKHPQLTFEIRLTAFSLLPTRDGLDSLRQNTGVKLRSRLSRSHNDGISLSPALFGDFINVLLCARVNRLTCFRDSWEEFWEMCETHLATGGNDIIWRNDKLDLVKPTDYSLYEGLKPAYDDDDTGYEAGYLPNEADLLENQQEADGNQKKDRIREPKSRMNTYYKQKAAALKRLSQASGNGGTTFQRTTSPKVIQRSIQPKAIQRPTPNGIVTDKPKRGRPWSRPQHFITVNGVPELKPRINEATPPVNGTVKQVKRKYVRKVPYKYPGRKVSRENKRTGRPLTVYPPRVSVQALRELKWKNVGTVHVKTEEVTSDSQEERDIHLQLRSTGRKRKTTGSGAEENVTSGKRKSCQRQRSYRCNDTTTVCVVLNQKISISNQLSGVWPSRNETFLSNGVVKFPTLPCHYPLNGSLYTKMPYHESSSLYNVGRSNKTVSRLDFHQISAKFTSISEELLENQEPPRHHSFIPDPLSWRVYMGEKLEHEVEITPITTVMEVPTPLTTPQNLQLVEEAIFSQEMVQEMPHPSETQERSIEGQNQEEVTQIHPQEGLNQLIGTTDVKVELKEISPVENLGNEECPQTSALDLSVREVEEVPVGVKETGSDADKQLKEEVNFSSSSMPECIDEIVLPQSQTDNTTSPISKSLLTEFEEVQTLDATIDINFGTNMLPGATGSVLPSEDDKPPQQTRVVDLEESSIQVGVGQEVPVLPTTMVPEVTSPLQEVECAEEEPRLTNGLEEMTNTSVQNSKIPEAFVRLSLLQKAEIAHLNFGSESGEEKTKRKRKATFSIKKRPQNRRNRENSVGGSTFSSAYETQENSSLAILSVTSPCSSRHSSTTSPFLKEVRIRLHRVNVIHLTQEEEEDSPEITTSVLAPVVPEATPGDDQKEVSDEIEFEEDEEENGEEEYDDVESSIQDGSGAESPEYVPSDLEDSGSSDEESRKEKSVCENRQAAKKSTETLLQINGGFHFQKTASTLPLPAIKVTSTVANTLLQKQIPPPLIRRRINRTLNPEELNRCAAEIVQHNHPRLLNMNQRNSLEPIDLDVVEVEEVDPLALDVPIPIHGQGHSNTVLIVRRLVETVDLVSDEEDSEKCHNDDSYILPDYFRDAGSPFCDDSLLEILPDLKNMDCTFESVLPDRSPDDAVFPQNATLSDATRGSLLVQDKARREDESIKESNAEDIQEYEHMNPLTGNQTEVLPGFKNMNCFTDNTLSDTLPEDDDLPQNVVHSNLTQTEYERNLTVLKSDTIDEQTTTSNDIAPELGNQAPVHDLKLFLKASTELHNPYPARPLRPRGSGLTSWVEIIRNAGGQGTLPIRASGFAKSRKVTVVIVKKGPRRQLRISTQEGKEALSNSTTFDGGKEERKLFVPKESRKRKFSNSEQAIPTTRVLRRKSAPKRDPFEMPVLTPFDSSQENINGSLDSSMDENPDNILPPKLQQQTAV